jgi:flagellar hook-associated protein 2
LGSSNTIFAGSSRYANDFGLIIDRAIAIASLPLSQLNNQKNALYAKSEALRALQNKIASLETSIANLGSGLASKTLLATASNADIVRPNLSSGALAGSYTLDILSAGSKTLSMSKDALNAVSDPYTQSISAATSFTLSVNGVDTVISPAANNLSELAKAINSSGAGVTANVINLGGNATPNYRLSLQSNKLGPVSVSLSDGTQDLLDTLSTGTLASYTVNGFPAVPIESDTRTVTIGMGISVDILRAGTTEVVVSQSAGPVADTLQAFVVAFNASIEELDKQHGPNAGPLRGDPLLYSIGNEFRSLTGFTAASGILTRLADVGITADKFGRLSFDRTKFQDATAENPQALLNFLGSETTPGFVQSATAIMKRLQESSTGFLPAAMARLTKEITRQDELIAQNQIRIDLMRDTLTAKMAAADALIAGLEQQVKVFNGIFEAQINARK